MLRQKMHNKRKIQLANNQPSETHLTNIQTQSHIPLELVVE